MPSPAVAPPAAPSPTAPSSAVAVNTAVPAPKPVAAQIATKVTLVNGRAVAPENAPPQVHRAVAAANRISGKPYRFGGGHAVLNDTAFDCSGMTSYVLREAGLMKGAQPSKSFRTFGDAGVGKWITVWARDGHVFLTIGGLRFDTTGSKRSDGPRWETKSRSKARFVSRHPRGL